MRISLNLLKKFVKFKTDDVKVIERAFTDKSAEIDEVEFQNEWLEKVVIWKIEKIEKHPDADRMQVTQTNIWWEILQIVCWAKNIFEWQFVPVALNWAILTWDFEIKKADKRWVESNWMICAETEIWIAEKSEWIMDLWKAFPDVDFEEKLWENFAEFYWLDDVIFIIENTAITNRPDLFSHTWWVREAVVIWIADEICHPEESEATKDPGKSHWINNCLKDIQNLDSSTGSEWQNKNDFPLNFSIENDVCTRMQAVKISNIKNWESPEWMQKILLSCWINSISLLVDLTNYVMVLQWVPVHAFDLSKINWKEIKMRKAKESEKITTLDWIEREVPENTILMEDEKQIFDLCWIMWWENSWVDKNTKEVWVHIPVYDPILIRRASISLWHRTDASTIYEKKVPDSQVVFAMKNMIDLILEFSPWAEISSNIFDYFPEEEKDKIINLSKEKLNYYLWEELESKVIEKILSDLWFEYKDLWEKYKITVPKFRLRDIEIEEDLIEEIMRVYWLDNIKFLKPDFTMKVSRSTNAFELEEKAKNTLVSQWAYEALNYSFLWKKLLEKSGIVSSDLIKITNPLSSELEFMRPKLFSYLLENIEKNILNEESFTLFEVARVFWKDWDKKLENKNLAFVSYNYEFFEAKKIAENLFEKLWVAVQFRQSKEVPKYAHWWQCADIFLQWKNVWNLATLHPKIAKNFDLQKNTIFMEINFEAVENAKIRIKKYKAFSSFPSVKRDQSFIIDEKTEISWILKKLWWVEKIQTWVELVDVYQWKWVEEWKKSITLSFQYWSMEKTLTDEEVLLAHKKVLEKAGKSGCEVR